MAWTAPRTYVTSEVVTASILNTDHRDNLLSISNAYRVTKLRRAASTAAAGSWTAITWDTEDIDELSAWVVGTPTRVTPTGSRFIVIANVFFTGATGTGGTEARLVRYNSSSVLQEVMAGDGSPTSGINGATSLSGFMWANAGE